MVNSHFPMIHEDSRAAGAPQILRESSNQTQYTQRGGEGALGAGHNQDLRFSTSSKIFLTELSHTRPDTDCVQLLPV